MVDLHCHSRYSDGSLTIEEILKLAEKSDIDVLAITDHDTVDGIEHFVNTDSNVQKVAGVEISVDWDKGTFHLVGLFIDHKNTKLRETLDKLKHFRRERNINLIKNLSELLGREVKLEEISDENYGELGRPHIAKFMVKEGVVKSIDEAFEKYLAKGKPLYVPKSRLSLEESISLINSAGGVSVIAHPITIITEDLDSFFTKMKDIGVDAVEAYCSLHSENDAKKYLSIAERYGFLVSMGSDFHGDNKKEVFLGKHGCNKEDAYRYYNKLKEYHESKFL
ncbi:PHP domain-containing protein [Calditerrivibrio nitroreducens]|uniref:PHP domain protein n=1 Tax=Calditerrivibrio nitroreducens (strain DSM 19672 / NBRC 101217 / Yu37-1) TaxID=768670 RepID=E4TH56_CALNY|nr:PHP domain-containing protein [Calditerrivibrio nitroreducens]ADR18750.1 PHP domain protein [Calditerrivibrio nitroreducens DSM 19672]